MKKNTAEISRNVDMCRAKLGFLSDADGFDSFARVFVEDGSQRSLRYTTLAMSLSLRKFDPRVRANGDGCVLKRLYAVVPAVDLVLLFTLLFVKEFTMLPNVLSSQDDVFMPVVTMCAGLLYMSLSTSTSSIWLSSSEGEISIKSVSLNSYVSLLIVCRVAVEDDSPASMAVECMGPKSYDRATYGDGVTFGVGSLLDSGTVTGVRPREVDRRDRRESGSDGDAGSRAILSDCESGFVFEGGLPRLAGVFAAAGTLAGAEDELSRLRAEPRSTDLPPPTAGGASSPLSSELNPINFLLAVRRRGVLTVAFVLSLNDFSFLKYSGRVVAVIGPTLSSPRAANAFLSSLSVSAAMSLV